VDPNGVLAVEPKGVLAWPDPNEAVGVEPNGTDCPVPKGVLGWAEPKGVLAWVEPNGVELLPNISLLPDPNELGWLNGVPVVPNGVGWPASSGFWKLAENIP